MENSAKPTAGGGRNEGPRIRREQKTVAAMIALYCRGSRHRSAAAAASTEGLCPQCAGLLEYATLRLERCPFGEAKSTCARCSIHCYKPVRRAEIRSVMRYAGPRMLLRHPVLLVRHAWDGRRSGKRA